jgi:hypothetical protein
MAKAKKTDVILETSRMTVKALLSIHKYLEQSIAVIRMQETFDSEEFAVFEGKTVSGARFQVLVKVTKLEDEMMGEVLK